MATQIQIDERMCQKAAALQHENEEYAGTLKDHGAKITDPVALRLALYYLMPDYKHWTDGERNHNGITISVWDQLEKKISEFVYDMYVDRFLNTTKKEGPLS